MSAIDHSGRLSQTRPTRSPALEAEAAEAEAEGPDLLDELAGGKLLEAVCHAAPEEHGPVEPLRQVERQFGERGDRRRRRVRGHSCAKVLT